MTHATRPAAPYRKGSLLFTSAAHAQDYYTVATAPESLLTRRHDEMDAAPLRQYTPRNPPR